MRLYEGNPRTITKKQFERLQDTLHRLGDLSGIVHDLNSDQIIGGNQRVRALDLLGHEPVIKQVYIEPTRTGTVKEGYYEIEGEHYSYRAVVWKPEQCEEANIAANIAGGDWDFDILSSWEAVKLKDWGFDAEKLAAWKNNVANMREMQNAEDENYSRKIEAPDYIPSDEKPSIEDLFDDSKTKELIEGIEHAEEITDDERAFLRIAAQRHTVLKFNRIADYYAHADLEIQALMEDSALVIIDFEKAISQGYIDLTAEIAEMVRDEYGDD